jgi:NAD(P)H-hydrate epimerase
MAAVTGAEMRSLELAVIQAGHSEEKLLDAAGKALGVAIGRHFPHPGTAIGYLGKGHNAGDTLVALRVLLDRFGWKISVRNAFPSHELAPLTAKKMAEMAEMGELACLCDAPCPLEIDGPLILLDGLVGLRGDGPLREPLAKLAAEMEWLRQYAGARVAAVDVPSGVDPDSGIAAPGAVVADATFMIGNAKVGLLFGHAASVTGALVLVEVDLLTSSNHGKYELITPRGFTLGRGPRVFDFHKGMAGRVSILAGSECYTGAAVLAAKGAICGGAGLVTLWVPKAVQHLVAAKSPVEAIVRGVDHPLEVLSLPCDALVVGCGLGELDSVWTSELLELIGQTACPMVVDADALNVVARSALGIGIFSANHVLTPHPGEFARLTPDLIDLPREEAARRLVERTPATLLLKGCRSIVTRHGQPLWSNPTGTPAMATGGQGDLLAGVIGAFLASGGSTIEAAALAAWVCGRAAEIAMNQRDFSEESLTPTDSSSFIGAALRDWKGAIR